MKKICVITRLRNDEIFLRKWVEYYGSIFGNENLYIYLDGKDQTIPTQYPNLNVTVCERITGTIIEADKGRAAFMSNIAKEMFANKYDIVIGCDIDELLVVDPKLGLTLHQYLSSINISTSLSGLGIDIGQHIPTEQEIDLSKPFLNQRKYALLCPKYTKPVVLGKPLRWGSGYHRIIHKDYHIDSNLFLFHFGSFDLKYTQSKLANKDRIASGWEKHIKKRTETITMVSNGKIRNWDKAIPKARLIQRIFRRGISWNKPAMLLIHIIVEIPKRFRNLA